MIQQTHNNATVLHRTRQKEKGGYMLCPSPAYPLGKQREGEQQQILRHAPVPLVTVQFAIPFLASSVPRNITIGRVHCTTKPTPFWNRSFAKLEVGNFDLEALPSANRFQIQMAVL